MPENSDYATTTQTGTAAATQATPSQYADIVQRQDAGLSEGDEFDAFENFAEKLVQVPKHEIDEKRQKS
jgi:hypothetical protein